MMILTLIVTHFNDVERLQRLLDSVGKLPTGAEMIVVDDASDAVAAREAERITYLYAAANDECVEFVPLQRNVGVGGARNAGFRRAFGEWLWFIDGDDELLPGAVERVMAHSRTVTSHCFTLPFVSLHPDGSAETVEMKTSDRLRSWECSVMAWSKVIRRMQFIEFRERVMYEDIDWWVKMCMHFADDRIAHMEGEPVYRYYIRQASSATAILEACRQAKGSAQDVAYRRAYDSQAALVRELERLIYLVAERRPEMLADLRFKLDYNKGILCDISAAH